MEETAASVASATEEIQSLISAIQVDTKDVLATIGEITGIILENDEITISIASAVEEQIITANEMNENMSTTSQGTEEITQPIK